MEKTYEIVDSVESFEKKLASVRAVSYTHLLRKSCLNIVVHDRNRSSVSDSIIYPLSCKEASHRLSLRYQAGISFE